MATTTVASPVAQTVKYNLAAGYLRGFLVALVVAHHAMLAYHPYAPPQPPASLIAQPRWWAAFPIVDSQRWTGFSVLVGFNDVFFMSLMFFLSGLFVWHGLKTKGSAAFLRGRLLRLGLPFAVAATLLAPLAYYPAYLQTPGHAGIAQFCRQWLALGQWPAGPAWFIWVLLAFDCIAALLFAVSRRSAERLGRLTSRVSGRPLIFFAILIGISALAYIPMALIFTPIDWTGFGPFAFQTSRILHYLAYFLIGAFVGTASLDLGLLAPDGKLARRWPLWVTCALNAFGIVSLTTILAITAHAQSQGWMIAMDAGFVLSCAASSFAFMALFVRFARSRSRFFDSLSANSYGIYLVHYAFVSWLQYALLTASLPAAIKGALVFLGALGLSWATAQTLRRIPAVARVM